MTEQTYNSRHVVYGVSFRHKVIYVGCTRRFKKRQFELLNYHPVIKHVSDFVSFKVIARVKGRRKAHAVESSVSTTFKKRGQCQLNVYASALACLDCTAADRAVWKYPGKKHRSQHWNTRRISIALKQCGFPKSLISL